MDRESGGPQTSGGALLDEKATRARPLDAVTRRLGSPRAHRSRPGRAPSCRRRDGQRDVLAMKRLSSPGTTLAAVVFGLLLPAIAVGQPSMARADATPPL